MNISNQLSAPSSSVPKFVFAAILALQGLVFEGSKCLAAPPEKPRTPGPSSIYDPDPEHLWNRLHRALWVRTGSNGKEYGHDRLDPYLWSDSVYLLEGERHRKALAVLDEFLAARGENLVVAPVQRAFLQRDLWCVFDWTTETDEAKHQAACRALQTRLARVMRQLALPAQQISKLSDNYAAAVAAKTVAEQHDPNRPEEAFLPPDLLQKDGSWAEIVIDNTSAVTASRHVLDFGARSAFRVFLRLPAGRAQTLEYLKSLNDFPRPWLANADRKNDLLRLNAELPQFAAGAQVALVRQMLLIDRDGALIASPLTESLQLRVFRTIAPIKADEDPLSGRTRGRDVPESQDSYEFTLERAALFAGRSGGLRPIRRDEIDFRTQLLVHTHDEFEGRVNDDVEKHMRRTMQSCGTCHDRPGIFSLPSYTGGNYPRPRYHLPSLGVGSGTEQGYLTARKKREQYGFGLLRGLWNEEAKK